MTMAPELPVHAFMDDIHRLASEIFIIKISNVRLGFCVSPICQAGEAHLFKMKRSPLPNSADF